MKGVRLPDGSEWTSTTPPGAYWLDARQDWYGVTPNGLLAGLRLHMVTQHTDQTITVEPSIAVSLGPYATAVQRWHGFLERGVWREC